MENKNLNSLIDKFNKGNNILITGQAGVGKTYLLNEFLLWLDDEGYEVALAGSTGVAAINIGGSTIHRMFGINRASSIQELLELIRHHQWIGNVYRSRMNNLITNHVIVIDEVSMIGSSLLELMDYSLRKFTKRDEPFGGIQMVFTGDFLQLPPVNDQFAFESHVWEEANFDILKLDKIYRQDDSNFIEVLSKIRLGIYDEQVDKFILDTQSNEISEDATKLYARNLSVDKDNESMLNNIDGDTYKFTARTIGKDNDVKSLSNNILAASELKLKIGSKVMSLVNEEELNYVNGSIGKVIDIKKAYVKVQFEDGYIYDIYPHTWTSNNEKGEEIASFEQMPLRLAYAITMHKSQGMTIDGDLFIDCYGIRTEGQFYVALSRIKNPDNIRIINFNRNIVRASEKALEFNKKI